MNDFQQGLGVLLGHVAGYVGHRTVQIGLEHGIFERFSEYPHGVSSNVLAAETGLDPLYLEVWCRSAYAAGVLDTTVEGYRLDKATATLLTDRDSPVYLSGLFPLLDQPESFDRFAERFASGERTWWDQFGSEFIRAVAETSRPAYLRLAPGGFAQIPGLGHVLARDADVLELACGAGFGLAHLPGRIMSGIQFVEAQIDDQLQPTQAYVDLLSRHGFDAVDSFEITPTHAVTHGRAPTTAGEQA